MNRRDFLHRALGTASAAVATLPTSSRAMAASREPIDRSRSLPMRSPTPDAAAESIPTGFADLDRLTGGLRRGSVTAICGRPSMGATALNENIALSIATRARLPVAFYAASMGEHQSLVRMLAIASGVDPHRLWCLPNTFQSVHMQYRDSLEMVGFDNRPLLPVCEVMRSAKAWGYFMSTSGRLGALIVDRPELLLVEDYGGTDQQRLARAMNGLKMAARALNVPVLVTANIGRAVEERGEREGDYHPRITDLAPAALPVAQTADVVILLYRDEVYYPETHDEGTVMLDVAHHRYRRTGTVRLAFDNTALRFSDYTWSYWRTRQHRQVGERT